MPFTVFICKYVPPLFLYSFALISAEKSLYDVSTQVFTEIILTAFILFVFSRPYMKHDGVYLLIITHILIYALRRCNPFLVDPVVNCTFMPRHRTLQMIRVSTHAVDAYIKTNNCSCPYMQDRPTTPKLIYLSLVVLAPHTTSGDTTSRRTNSRTR